jgi:hypothetical protein
MIAKTHPENFRANRNRLLQRRKICYSVPAMVVCALDNPQSVGMRAIESFDTMPHRIGE